MPRPARTKDGSKSAGKTVAEEPPRANKTKELQADEDCGFVFFRKKPKVEQAAEKPVLTATSSQPDTLPEYSEDVPHVADDAVNMVNRRRSSLALRGKRKSSANASAALPPASILPEKYYNHISKEIPDVMRMKQLLTWLFERQLQSAAPSVNVVCSGIMKALREGAIDISWYSRGEEDAKSVTDKRLQPNPRNVDMRRTLKSSEDVLSRLQKEEREWLAIKAKLEAKLQGVGKIGASMDGPEAFDALSDELKATADRLNLMQPASTIVAPVQEKAHQTALHVDQISLTCAQLERLADHAKTYSDEAVKRVTKISFKNYEAEPRDLIKNLTRGSTAPAGTTN